MAQASEFVARMDGGYSAAIAQGGSNVSGGQKQRLSIARAVYRHPEILIFDDSFSALDFKTDREVRDALAREAKDSTKLIVAQRIGTIMTPTASSCSTTARSWVRARTRNCSTTATYTARSPNPSSASRSLRRRGGAAAVAPHVRG